MLGQGKLLLLWACLLLAAALCPGAHCQRGGGFRGRWGKGVGMGLGSKLLPSQSRGSSNQGLGLAGAAGAAGVGALGGAAIGYGLGSLGRKKYGGGHGRGYDRDSSEEDRRTHYPKGPGLPNQSDHRHSRGAAGPGPVPTALTVLLTLVPLVWAQWGGVGW